LRRYFLFFRFVLFFSWRTYEIIRILNCTEFFRSPAIFFILLHSSLFNPLLCYEAVVLTSEALLLHFFSKTFKVCYRRKADAILRREALSQEIFCSFMQRKAWKHMLWDQSFIKFLMIYIGSIMISNRALSFKLQGQVSTVVRNLSLNASRKPTLLLGNNKENAIKSLNRWSLMKDRDAIQKLSISCLKLPW
jgi:hypothetical protein